MTPRRRKPATMSGPIPLVTPPVRICSVCGARVRNINPSQKINTCDQVCRDAKKSGISRSEQLQREADALPWPEKPFEHEDLISGGRARRSFTLSVFAS